MFNVCVLESESLRTRLRFDIRLLMLRFDIRLLMLRFDVRLLMLRFDVRFFFCFFVFNESLCIC